MTHDASVPWGDAIETATATVFFAGDYAVKVKKPQDFGYVDFRAQTARRQACENEVALNRRLAPDVYLGVADLVVDGQVKDHLVLMRRMPEDRRLSVMLSKEPPAQAINTVLPAIAATMADFHARAESVSDMEGPGSHRAIRHLWQEGTTALRSASDVVAPIALSGITTLAAAYLEGRKPLFDDRLHRGFVRDGHGDLLADDIFWLDDGPRILDCLEFDDRLRICDVWMDMAFLAMDLERLGHPDHAHVLLDTYADLSGTSAPQSLRHFFIAYRALVRTKVAAIRHAQGDQQSRLEAERLTHLCLQHLRRATVTLTILGGLPGTGKTTLAAAVAAETGAMHLSSDVIRKEIHGFAPEQAQPEAWESGLYDRTATQRTYDEMLRRATIALARGESVVLDATWRMAESRDRARRVARDAAAAFADVRCEVPQTTALQRLEAREPGSSDAGTDTYRRISSSFDAWPEAVTVATDRGDAPTRAVAAIARAIHQLERGLGT